MNRNDTAVVILDAETRQGFHATIDLKQHDVPVVAVSHSPFAAAFMVRGIIRKKVHSPSESLQTFIDEVINICKALRNPIVLPTSDRSLFALNIYRERLTKVCNLAIPDDNIIRIALDKALFIQYIEKTGCAAPKTYHILSTEKVKEVADNLRYPVIIKPRLKVFRRGDHVLYAPSPEIAWNKYEFIDKYMRMHCASRYPLISEYIYGSRYGFDFLAKKGSLVAFLIHKTLVEYPQKKGISAACESTFHKQVFKCGRVFLDSLRLTGLGMLEFRVKGNQVFPIELNARLWGSSYLAIKAGVDFPWLLYCLQVYGNANQVMNIKFVKSAFLPDILMAGKDNLSNLRYLPYVNIKDFLIPSWFISSLRSKKRAMLDWHKIVEVTWITEGLAIGSDIPSLNLLKQLGISLIVDLREEHEVTNFYNTDSEMQVLRFPIPDGSIPRAKDLLDFLRLIDMYLNKGKRIYVRCAQGMNRSCLFATLFLVHRGYRVDDALKFVKAKRKICLLTTNQLRFLEEFEQYLTKKYC